MTERLVPPDIATAARAYLTTAYTAASETATVYEELPDVKPKRFTVLKRQGGSKRGRTHDTAILEVGCYAATPADALALANLTRSLLWQLAGQVASGVAFTDVVEVAGPALMPHPASASPRYRFTEQVDARLTTA
jgi:hypothetical protein